ncbi:MAG: hypothetical protein ACI37O_06980 [Candidatus Avelusimicrobium sp.]|uniref:hypothetical protein n=1 Tax=Candidatus Avelusimicrobium sp. TaxID=3048833 RepID=UPI003F0C36D0
MNIFKWITGRAGKVALSAMQAVGLTAVVGVAGVAAWQYLDSPAETNNMFTPAAYDSGEVVYVAGANTGAYAGGSYAGGGESQSSMQISTNTLKRLERQEMSQRAAEEMAEYAPDYSASVASSAPTQAYQMGGTEGLGTGANVANEFDLKNNPMAAMQQSMAGVTDMISQAQAQAQQQAQAAAPGQAPAGAPTLASASKNWGSSGATSGGSSGNAFNSSFTVQDSGKSKGSVSAADAAKQAGDVMASAQAQAARMMREGSSMRARSSFGNNNMIGEGRDASVQNSRTSKDGRDLDFIRRRSADAAKNKNRSVVEGARAFLASTKISGGMMISADNVTTGQGQGSKDFNQDYDANLRGIKTWSANIESETDRRNKDRHNLQTWLWVTVGVAIAAMVAIPFVKNIPIFGWAIALGLTLAVAALVALTITKAGQFMRTWKTTDGWAVAAIVVAGLMALGVAASWIWSSAFKEFFTKIGNALGIGGGTGGGTGGASGELCINTIGQPTGALPGGAGMA